MRVVFCWEQLCGYMAACWRELAKVQDIELLVFTAAGGVIQKNAPFDATLIDGFPCQLLEREELTSSAPLTNHIRAFKPDIVYVSGWSVPAFTQLAWKRELADARFIMGMDNPFINSWRQRLARYKIGALLRRMDRIVVPGERAWQFASHLLQIPDSRLRKGLYGVDTASFAVAHNERQRNRSTWPKGFVFCGRYENVKGIDVLLDAYQQYRRTVADPWSLTCCGQGSYGSRVEQAAGVTNSGFVDPRDLPRLLSNQGVSILPSRFDPWPLTIVEHCAAGLPQICSESCGSSVELVRPHYNGLTVPADDTNALSAAMLKMHLSHSHLPEMGRRSHELARPYSAQMWSLRWTELLQEVLEENAELHRSPTDPEPIAA